MLSHIRRCGHQAEANVSDASRIRSQLRTRVCVIYKYLNVCEAPVIQQSKECFRLVVKQVSDDLLEK